MIGSMTGMRRQARTGRTLSEGALTGLFFLSKYRFLTIAQFARIANFSAYHAAEVLRDFDRWGVVGFFGYTSIPGQGKTPKVYFVKRKGFDLLCSENSAFEDILGEFAEIHNDATWSPHMYHRLRIIDLMISAECALQKRPHLRMAQTFLSYRMIKKGGRVTRETTDFVDRDEISENKLVPDAAFIMENIDTQRSALFFLEMDMGNEQIISRIVRHKQTTIRHKLWQYDRYLQSKRYTQTYANYGEFHYFILLFVTTSDERVENIRREMVSLPHEFANYYRFTTFEKAMSDFLGQIWRSRSVEDTGLYALVKGSETDG